MVNNMGGFSEAEIVFIDEITSWSHAGDGLQLECRVPRHPLTEVSNGIKLSAVPKTTKSGTIYQHKVEISVKNGPKLRSELPGIGSRGFLVVAKDRNQQIWVYGHPDYPLFGSIEQIPGSKPTDLHKWRITANCQSLEAELPLK